MPCIRRAAWTILLAAAWPALALAQSHDITLLSHQDLYLADDYASCWGWTSPGGQEFALIGTTSGTSIVDVTTPTAPQEKAFIAGVASSWREMKTYSHYAYIVTEGLGGGMQIVDLATSPPSLVAVYTGTFNRAHTITIEGNFAYVSGARVGNTQVGIRFLDLTNPTAPVDVGGWNGHYTHDCYVRGNTLWAAGISNGVVSAVNITNKAAPVVLKTFTWPGNAAHNCELTVDGRYLLTTDETAGGHLHVFDVQDVQNPVLVAEWEASPNDIIHNVHIRGDRAYVAYYTAGVRVLDIGNPAYPVEIAYYDTWPGVSGSFDGNWEVYPYAASGNLYLSDISTGLYVVRHDPTTGSVSGTVREFGGGTPVPGAQVSIVGIGSAAASATAYYKLFAPPGPRSVAASAFGFYADTTEVSIVLGTDTPHDFDLVRLPGSAVGGTVRNASTLAPLATASLVLDGTPLQETSDGSGAYDLGSVPYGVYTITASRFGFASQRHTVTVSAQEPLPGVVANFDLAPAALATDYEAGAAGWTRISPVNNATSGLWVWSDPVGSGGGGVQPEDDHTVPGTLCWVTGNAPNPSDNVGTADVDGGATILRSPVFSTNGITNPTISYWRWFSNNAGAAPGSDTLRVQISNDGGASWKVVENVLASAAQWTQVTVPIASLVLPTANMRFQVIAEDLGAGSVVEAAFDDFMVFAGTPTASPLPPVGYALRGAMPNPFNPSTQVHFELGAAGPTHLTVYDARGRLVRALWSGFLTAGPHRIGWDGRDTRGRAVASGAYIVRLESGTFVASERLTLVK